MIAMSIFVMLHAASDDSFLTDSEYGKYLYENPRGISCKSCHGPHGEGMLLATYPSNDKTREVSAPSIIGMDIESFRKGTLSTKGVMPKYYLTTDEIDAIYRYLEGIKTQN